MDAICKKFDVHTQFKLIIYVIQKYCKLHIYTIKLSTALLNLVRLSI
jgi:hypothetical protein